MFNTKIYNIKKPISKLENLFYKKYRFVHSIRIAISFITSLTLIKIINIQNNSWPLITLIVIIGPISFLGNVFIKSIQRIIGTILGTISGLITLKLELISNTAMILWVITIVSVCGYLTLGKMSYIALLINITMAIICNINPENWKIAIWRCIDIIIGTMLAILFSILWPQRAYIYWRIKLSEILSEISKLYKLFFLKNKIKNNNLNKNLEKIYNKIINMRSLLQPIYKEIKISKKKLENIQKINKNIIFIIELQMNIWKYIQHNKKALLEIKKIKYLQYEIVIMFKYLSIILINPKKKKIINSLINQTI